MKRIDTRWLSNPDAKPAKELSKHDQEMIQLGWDAANAQLDSCEKEHKEKVREIFDWLGVYENELGYCEISNHIPYKDYQALKEKHYES